MRIAYILNEYFSSTNTYNLKSLRPSVHLSVCHQHYGSVLTAVAVCCCCLTVRCISVGQSVAVAAVGICDRPSVQLCVRPLSTLHTMCMGIIFIIFSVFYYFFFVFVFFLFVCWRFMFAWQK